MFKKYQHLEKFGTTAVKDIQFGECYIFPKIDGTNASVWMCDGQIQVASRRRELSEDKDNAGFYKYVKENESIQNYLEKNPTHRIFGEFLVPHSLKTYREDTWRKFYVFDVVEDLEDELDGGEKFKYLHYETYKPLLDEHGLDYIPPISIIKNGSIENFHRELEKNIFLIKDGEGIGEGIVIKNYDYINKFGRITWAKIVTSEFKEKHVKEMGASTITASRLVEESIVDKYCTEALIEKEFAKINNEDEGWTSKMIPRLINTVYYCLITEECWNFIKENKNPTIDFKALQFFTTKKIKKVKEELF